MTNFLSILFLFLALILSLSRASDSSNHIILSLNKPTSEFIYGEWIVGPNGRYYQFNTARSSWLDSREYCLSHNADLVSLEDGSILVWLLSHYVLVGNRRTVQIGLSKDERGEWYWGNGNKFNSSLKFENATSNNDKCAGIMLGEVVLKTLNCTDSGKEPVRFICERDRMKHEEQQRSSNYVYEKLQSLFDYFGIGGNKEEKKEIPPEIDYEEPKEIKEEAANITKKEETSKEEQATVNKVLGAVQQQSKGESTVLKELEEGSGQVQLQQEGILLEKKAIQRIEEGEKRINDLIKRLENMMLEIEAKEKLRLQEAITSTEKPQTSSSTTKELNTTSSSTITTTATTTTPQEEIVATTTTVKKHEEVKEKFEDEDLLVTERTTTGSVAIVTTTQAVTTTTTEAEKLVEEKKMVEQIEDDFKESKQEEMPVADLTPPPLADCDEESEKERKIKKVLQTVKTFLDRATRQDLIKFLNTTNETNLLEKLEEGISIANKREFEAAQLLKEHNNDEILQVTEPGERFMTDEEREALYNKITEAIISNIEAEKRRKAQTSAAATATTLKPTTQQPTETTAISSTSTSSTSASTTNTKKVVYKVKHAIVNKKRNKIRAAPTHVAKKRKGKRSKKIKNKSSKKISSKSSKKTKTTGDEIEGETHAIFSSVENIQNGTREHEGPNKKEFEKRAKEIEQLAREEARIEELERRTRDELRRLNKEEKKYKRAEKAERLREMRHQKSIAKKRRAAARRRAAAAAVRRRAQEETHDDATITQSTPPSISSLFGTTTSTQHKSVLHGVKTANRRLRVRARKARRERRRQLNKQRRQRRQQRHRRVNRVSKKRQSREKSGEVKPLTKFTLESLNGGMGQSTDVTVETKLKADKKVKKRKQRRGAKTSKPATSTTTTTTEEPLPKGDENDELPEKEGFDSDSEYDSYEDEYEVEEAIESKRKNKKKSKETEESSKKTTKDATTPSPTLPTIPSLEQLIEQSKTRSNPLGTTSAPIPTLPSIDKLISDWQENINKLFPPVGTKTTTATKSPSSNKNFVGILSNK